MYWKAIGPDRFKAKSICNFAGQFMYVNGEEPSKYHALGDRYIVKLLKNLIVILGLTFISYNFLNYGPIYGYYFKNIRTTPMGTKLPYFEEGSDVEFLLNLSLQSVIGIFAILGNFSIEGASCLANNVIVMVPELIHLDLEELTNEMEVEGHFSNIKYRLRNLFVKINQYDR